MEVTSKEKAGQFVLNRDTQLVESLINAIESKILTSWVPGGRVLVYPDVVFRKGLEYALKMNAIRTAQTLYENAGWSFKYNSSQRDGDWIEVK